MNISAKKRALRTAIQVVVSVFIGLVITVWRVDGVPQAVFEYLRGEMLTFFGTSGLVGAIMGYLMNRNK